MSKFNKITGASKRDELTYSPNSKVMKHAEGGLDWKPLGSAATALRVEDGTPTLIYNSSSSVAYVTFGDNTVAAPTSPATGIPIAANEKFVMNSGSSAFVRGSSASIFVYQPAESV